MIILNHSINTMQNYAKWMHIDTCIIKLNMFIQILKMMLKNDLMHQIMKSKDHYQYVKIKKVIGLMKDELRAKIMTEFVGLLIKRYSCLIDDDNENNKSKGTKKNA